MMLNTNGDVSRRFNAALVARNDAQAVFRQEFVSATDERRMANLLRYRAAQADLDHVHSTVAEHE